MEVLIEQLNRHYKGKSNATQKPILALALAVLLPLLTCGGALAQDLSGIYYIASEYDAESESAGTQYSSTGSPASHFYWVPAKNAVRDNKEDAYYKYSIYGYEKPYLTTYQTNRDLNSIWVLQKTGDYYYIIHALTGKYLVYSPIVPDPSHATRRVVHLAAQTDPNVDSAKFTVTQDANGKTLFVPKLKSSGDRYLNPAGHNRQSYSAVNEKDYSGGIIGVWSGNTGLSLWHLEDASEDVNIMPVISDLDPASNTFTITSPLSLFISIRYTDDGSTPTHVDGTLYSGTVALTETKTINAVAYFGTLTTAVATKTLTVETISDPTITINCDNTVVLSCETAPSASIRYTVNGAAPTTSTGTLYDGTPITIAPGDVVRAIAYSPLAASGVSTATANNSVAPTVTYADGNITISGTGTLHYTTNGTDPVIGAPGVTSSNSAVTIPYDGLSEVDVRAIAKVADRDPSCVARLAYWAKPALDETSCDNEVSLTCASTDAEIHFTTDGSEPTPSSYTFYEHGLADIAPGTRVRAKAFGNGFSSLGELEFVYQHSHVSSPTYYVDGQNVSFSALAGSTIWYTKSVGSVVGVVPSDPADPTDPLSGRTQYTGTPVVIAGGNIITVFRFFAEHNTMGSSCVTRIETREGYSINNTSDLDKLTAHPNSYFVLLDDIDAGGYSTLSKFTGMLDGNGHTISNLSTPIFDTIAGGSVYNLYLKGVSIETSGTAGAIARVAKGYSRIYNCGILPNDNTFPGGTHPKVETTGNCAGGLVGWLKDDSRVVNCFSFADVNSADTVAGIVGNNTFASNAAQATVGSDRKYTNLRTMVVNCLFYGDITGGSHLWPVYGGQMISNTGANAINNYDYYRAESSFSGAFVSYNCSWPAIESYLTQVEFHRYLINSNRELCGWWVESDVAPSTLTTEQVQSIGHDASKMYKWVIVPSVAPYPILMPFGKYTSITNLNAGEDWINRSTANEFEGKRLGTLKNNVNAGAHHSATTIVMSAITDMDILHSDYCYGKVQLPFYNTVFGNPDGADWASKYADNYSDYVVSGWEITSVVGGEAGTFVEDWETGYNFADRKCTQKDLYSVSGRVFAQGGYYYVPDGVTEITITAHWATAYYLGNAEHSYDRVYMSSNNSGVAFAPAGTRPTTTGGGQTVLTSKISTVANSVPSNGSVFDYAIVLVGNQQYRTLGEHVKGTNETGGFTLMSVDLDFDEEPDYCLEWQLGINTTRQSICPIRFDFLPVVEIGLALKENGFTQYYSLGCYRTLGHFEVTESALIRFGQFEFGNDSRTLSAPLILNGGIYEQFTKGTVSSATAADDDITYIIVGGNVVMPSFTPGAHVRNTNQTRHCAVNAIGGHFDYFYLTGNYNENVTPNADNPHCYIDGGLFGQVAAAGKEGINGNVFFQINHAVIHEFYGGGTMVGDNKIVKGSIDVTIDNSRVTKYCGGPKFGDMIANQTVTTLATGTWFGVYYGGGNGGTNYMQYDSYDNTVATPNSFNWGATGKVNSYTPGGYRSTPKNYMANYELEMVNVSSGTQSGNAVVRSYFYAAQFASTNTGAVTNTLTSCIVDSNFYGAGNLGGVNGDVTSTLTDTWVRGSAFGAGFSADIPEVTIQNKDRTPPSINIYTGLITPASEGTSTTYTWTHSEGSTSSPISADNKYFYTEDPLENLGTVTGNVTLTINGNSVIGHYDNHTLNGGNVFGGGQESAVTGNVTVNLQDNAEILGNVYGGGDKGLITGSTQVNIKD